MGEKAARSHVFCLTPVASLLPILLDGIRAHRSNFWTGDNPLQMIAPAAPFIVYSILIGLVATIVTTVLARRFNAPHIIAIISLWIAAATLAGMLFTVSEGFSIRLVLAYMSALTIALLFLTVLEKTGLVQIRFGAMIVVLSMLVAWPAMHAIGHEFYIDASRHTMVTIAAGVWSMTAALLMFGLATYKPQRMNRALAVVFLALFVGPIVVPSVIPRDTEAIAPEEPSLIFVTFDALRADYCSVYGGKAETPNFERIAQDGVVFEYTYALAPWTLPSVNSLYSSTYPYGLTPGAPWDQWRHEVSAYTIDSTQQTLAQRLQAKGYATALMTGNALLGQHAPMRRGFDTVFRLGPDVEGLTGLWAYVPTFLHLLERIAPKWADMRPVDTTTVLRRYAQEFFRQHRGQPIFVWLHFLDPHDPYNPPDRFMDESNPWDIFRPRMFHIETPDHRADGTLEIDPKHTDYVRALYEGEIQYADEAFGQVYDTTLETGHAENAVVVLSADHGEEFWDHGKWGHGHSLFNEVVRVPLIIKASTYEPGIFTKPFSHIDLIPTLADLMQAGQDEAWQGKSRVKEVLGSNSAEADFVFTRATHLFSPEEPLEMTVVDPYKLIVGLESSKAALYNLRDDPGEQSDLAQDQEDVVNILLDALNTWHQFSPATFDELHAGQDAPVNDDILEIMDALGYIH